ncbi:guanylate cyclase-like protein, putative [Bodo saltans]|uniref:Guanylate cyclase-like protein, putative n=1 Tax=Bodo saltans TaxID=75058 RepID=A0A0S4J8T4_BODSA|nr:guanylate cyclase-like protein, putative [Bodo saltans]|eukprot:CUG87823.1 guanylate cyclase-like protein, putative [Bodo saltans]
MKSEDSGAHESIFERHYHAIREGWHRTPFLHRIFSFTLVFFALLFVCFVVLLVDDSQQYQDDADMKYYPGLLRLLGNVAQATSAEGEISAQFVTNQTDANWDALAAARSTVDTIQSQIADYFKQYQGVTLNQDYNILQGTRLSEVGIGSVYIARTQITQGQVIVPAQQARKLYYDINARILQQMAKTAATLTKATPTTAVLKSVALASIGWQVSQALAGAAVFKAQPANISYLRESLKQFGASSYRTASLGKFALLPIQRENDREYLLPTLAGRQLGEQQQNLLRALTATTTYVATTPLSVNVSFASARAVLAAIQGSTISAVNDISVTRYARSLVMALVAIVVFVVAFTQWIIVESLNAEENAIRIRNAHVMHDVLVRVGELVDHMASFALDPLPPPRSMMGTRVGMLELRLQHCVASLKALAPTLPPLLFPNRLSALAADYSEVKDPATMQFTKKPRESLLKEPLQQVRSEDIANNKHASRMRELTQLQVEDVRAAFLFVDLSFYHEMSTVEKMQFSNETFHEVASLIEECVYQFKGVLHAFALDRAIGVWNVATPSSNYCEQAATCALVLSNRLTTLRRHNRHLREHFQVRIGVVSGPVRRGIFGDKGAKYLQLFGDALEKGIKVARANSFHLTTVACDETVRRAVDKIFLPKPIELLDDGSRIYEVIHEGSRKEADLETQLLVYSKAFELYEKKYYREALRAFRGYTKLYGYDSSVERIQALITGM